METASEAQAAATVAPACATLSAWVTSPSAADAGRSTRVRATKTGPMSVKGTGMPAVSQVHAQQSIRKPYNFTTRIYALGGGAAGPHPAREPEPV
jgi:hypothetical protein